MQDIKTQYRKEMVLGGNICVTLGSKYIGTYYCTYDMDQSIKDLGTVGSYWKR